MRLYPFCLPLLALSAILPPAWGQVSIKEPTASTVGDRKQNLRDFDIRALPPDAAGRVPTQTLDHRLANLEALRSSGVRISASPYGLPKLMRQEGGVLTAASSRDPEQIARDFLRTYRSVFPFQDDELNGLRLLVKDVAGNATFLTYNQTIGGIDVFNAQIKLTLTQAGEVVQAAAGDLIPGVKVPGNPGVTARDAACAALAFSGVSQPCALSGIPGDNGKMAFQNPAGDGRDPITAELTVFPMNADSARLAWRLFVAAEKTYEILVDAQDGTLLFRHQLEVYDAQARVWTESPSVGTRQLVTLPAAWLNGTVTSGNNADVFADVNNDDQPDANNSAGLLSGHAYSPIQLFDNPFADGLTGKDPRNSLAAGVTNLFYYVNLAHDYYYRLGFTEAAGNFQADNFSRGGLGGDPLLAEAQQGGTVDNANFTPTPDGKSPRMRVGVFTRGTSKTSDDLDADYDGQVIFHEYGHGVSNRLVGGRTSTSCLTGLQSGAMGEGWSDYFSISFYNNPVEGAYSAQNFVHGIRRQSYEGYTYTYEDLGNGKYGFEVHDDGEVWAATLWDLRKSLGQTITDQLVINGLKSTPCNPSMIDARDAIFTADQVTYGGSHRAQMWQVFARHGMGYSAAGLDGHIFSGTIYNAAFDQPADLQGSPGPRITSAPPFDNLISLGDSFTYRVTASNPAGGTLSYALTQGPAGMTIDPASGLVQWTASFTAKRVKVTVTDGKGGRVVHGFLVPILTIVTPGSPIVTAGAIGDTGYVFVLVPSSTPALQVTLRGGTGDADLYLYGPSGAFYGFSGHDGNNEGLTVPLPARGYWQVLVYGYQDFDKATFTANLVTPPLLDSGVPVKGLSGILDSETLYRVRVPVGGSSLKINTSGGTGDVDVFMKYGFAASCLPGTSVVAPCYYDLYSANPGNSESISLDFPRAGDYYLDLVGYMEYAGVTLTATVVATPSLSVGPSFPSITVPEGSTAIASQNLTISSAGSPVFNWTAQVVTQSGGNWLSISRASGTGNATIQVTLNPAGLTRGVYLGSVTVRAPNLIGSPVTIPVALVVSPPAPVPSAQ